MSPAPHQHPGQLHVAFPGRLVMIGFGSIGQGVLPLLLRHVGMKAERITIVTAEERGAEVAREYGVRFLRMPLTRENYREVLAPLLAAGDFLLNLSVEVSSLALIELAREAGALCRPRCAPTTPCARGRSSCASQARRRPPC